MRCATALVLSLFLSVTASCGDNTTTQVDPPLPPVEDPLEWVEPTIGTGGFGFAYGSAFVGAAAPHGLVKLGPDTSGEFGTIGFQHFSGYYAGDNVIEAFSHLHLHGAGLSDYGLVGVMPTTSFSTEKMRAEDYRATFDKATEVARPGRYQVTLTESEIAVDLVATTRSAHHHYAAATAQPITIVVDLARKLDGGEIDEISLVLDEDNQTLQGSLRSSGQMSGGYGGHELFFVARSRLPWTSTEQWDQGAALTFAAGESPELQFGFSFVSTEGAAANLAAELPGWDIDETANQTREAWRELLSAVLVEGGTARERRIFYSSLYRSFLMPTITSDVDGTYSYGGETGDIGIGSFVSDLSLWDTYRTLHPLYHLLAPLSGADSIRSLVAMERAGEGFPRWPIATGESGTMLGASADVVVADGLLKLGDIDGVDEAAVFDRLVALATDTEIPAAQRGGRNPADDYLALGFVPDSVGRSVSTHLEYAVDDYALSQLADSLAETELADMFAERSKSYRQLYDARTQTFRPRSAEGEFADTEGYDPLDFGEEFAEANAAQMFWAPLHDAEGLSELVGGDDALTDRLLLFFENAALDLESNPLDELLANAAPRPHYWHGNEPDIHAAYLFGQLGRDDLTQRWLAWIRAELYDDTPAGLAGNDDSGTLSSWYVWTALGIYPIAGSDRYMIGAPIFTKATIRTAAGTLTIEAPEADKQAGVAAVAVNESPLERAELSHQELVGDRVIRFEMTAEPTAWSQPR